MTTAKSLNAQLREALSAALEYIDAIPSEAADKFPAMPGFDRDWVDGLIAESPTDKDKIEVTLLGNDSDVMTVLVKDQSDPKLNGIYSMKRITI